MNNNDLRTKYLKEAKSSLAHLEKRIIKIVKPNEQAVMANRLLIKVIETLEEVKALQLFPLIKENVPFVATRKHLVDTAGQAKQFPKLHIPPEMSVLIKALVTNAAMVYVANSKAEAEDHTLAYMMDSGDVVEYEISELEQLWLDAEVANDGVTWTVEQEAVEQEVIG